MAFICNIPTGRYTYKNVYIRIEKVEFLKGNKCLVSYASYQAKPDDTDIALVTMSKEFDSSDYEGSDPFEYAYNNTKQLFDIIQDNV